MLDRIFNRRAASGPAVGLPSVIEPVTAKGNILEALNKNPAPLWTHLKPLFGERNPRRGLNDYKNMKAGPNGIRIRNVDIIWAPEPKGRSLPLRACIRYMEFEVQVPGYPFEFDFSGEFDFFGTETRIPLIDKKNTEIPDIHNNDTKNPIIDNKNSDRVISAYKTRFTVVVDIPFVDIGILYHIVSGKIHPIDVTHPRAYLKVRFYFDEIRGKNYPDRPIWKPSHLPEPVEKHFGRWAKQPKPTVSRSVPKHEENIVQSLNKEIWPIWLYVRDLFDGKEAEKYRKMGALQAAEQHQIHVLNAEVDWRPYYDYGHLYDGLGPSLGGINYIEISMELPGKPTDAFLEGTQRKVEDKDSLSRNSRINNNGFMVEVDTFENRDEWVRDRLLPLAAAVNMYHGNEIGIHIHLRLYFVDIRTGSEGSEPKILASLASLPKRALYRSYRRRAEAESMDILRGAAAWSELVSS